MELKRVTMEIPEGANIIIGQAHFIKSVEDLYESMVGAVPNAIFGIAFCEASGACLVRKEGNDGELIKCAVRNASSIAAGHSFVIIMKDVFPINVLNAIKGCQEVCTIFCATANPVEVIIAETELGRGILGIIDGSVPKGIEDEKDINERKSLLRKFGYKR
ncbi:MAG: adenosine-specific kinase [Candidatus Scalindua sp.]|nr:adenosine-specific kinase [Candidatus Scalindua sp.]